MIDISLCKKVRAPITDKAIHSIVFLVARNDKRLRGKIDIIMLDTKEMKKVNKEYRGFNKPTDVLSFSDIEWRSKLNTQFVSPVQHKYAGTVYVCPPYIKKQAQRFNVSFGEEFIRMLIHGLLHIAGHDHDKTSSAKRMFALQELVLSKSKVV